MLRLFYSFFILFFAFVLKNSLVAQEAKGVIYYKGQRLMKQISKFEEKDSLGNFKEGAAAKFYQDRMKRNKPVEFKLVFSDTESAFFLNQELILDSEKRNPSRNLKKSYYYYVNHKNNELKAQKEFAGTLFLIESNLDSLTWRITSESKMFGQYKALKAISSIKIVNRSKEIQNYEMEAWFSPELSFQFGPEGYYGLPGLIVEMDIFGYKYTFDRIDLDPRNEKINSPSGGKRVTNQKYLAIIQDFSLVDSLKD